MLLFGDGWWQRELKDQLQALEEEKLVVRCGLRTRKAES